MRYLHLLRHAKSTWDDASHRDFERPLANRGRKDCALIAEFIQEKGIDFDLVLVSTAVRTRETIELINERTKYAGEVRYDERIYEATVSQLLEIVSQIDNDRESVLLVGHNPGLEELLAVLTGEQQRVTPAGFAKIKIEATTWCGNLASKGTLDWIIRPEEI